MAHGNFTVLDSDTHIIEPADPADAPRYDLYARSLCRGGWPYPPLRTRVLEIINDV